jgi:hypothetical protein
MDNSILESVRDDESIDVGEMVIVLKLMTIMGEHKTSKK